MPRTISLADAKGLPSAGALAPVKSLIRVAPVLAALALLAWAGLYASPASAADPVDGTPPPADGQESARARPGRAAPVSSWSLAHLYDVMSREDPLNERDIDLYISHLDRIEALKEDPSGLSEILVATGWSESRLAYVTTKTGIALLGHLDPDGLKTRKIPPFARPSRDETALVLSREPAIAKAYAQVIRNRRAKAAPDSPPPPARKGARRKGA
ncbi:MAG: hypothetical protein LBR80_18295 [Deltaproteobacteria bacterium]|nr:hypothetical protein [Deltaproteobacteria bacterium]